MTLPPKPPTWTDRDPRQNEMIPHPSGGFIFGSIPRIDNKSYTIEGGEIILRAGRHSFANRGFGVRHIWAEHQLELIRLGFTTIDQVPGFVASIILIGTPIYCEFNDSAGKHRLCVLRSSIGQAIVQPIYDRHGTTVERYSVVTAFTKLRAEGVLVGKVI